MTRSATSTPIAETIARLRALTQVSLQATWRYCDRDLPLEEALDAENWQTWQPAEVNDRDHLPWEKGRVVRWFSTVLTVPETLQGYPLKGLCLRLALLWWAREAKVFVNGKLVQEGDLFDCAPRLLLNSFVEPGEQYTIALRLVSPGHDEGALMKSVCHYEVLAADQSPEPAFVASELEVLHSYLQAFEPETIAQVESAIAEIDWSTVGDRLRFDQSLSELRRRLEPLAQPIQQQQIKLLGHAHLDMAWLWTLEDTWKAAENTFRSVLSLQQDFSELIFCHSTPALYEWVEQHRPDLFAQIQAQVKAQKWEPIGGLWIEPDMNLISGEAIARQILYGQRYLQARFGTISRFCWLPDTFGFTWQLPQLLRQGGIDCFVTQKLRWNDTTQFPYEVFHWQAPDGTPILSLMSAPIGEGIDPVKMAAYCWEWQQKTGLPIALWLPGVGDHGGGPTRDMLEVARRWQQSPFFPPLEFATADAYLNQLAALEQNSTAESKGSTSDREVSTSEGNALTVDREVSTSEGKVSTPDRGVLISEGEVSTSEGNASTVDREVSTSELNTSTSELHTSRPTLGTSSSDAELPTSEPGALRNLPVWNSELYLEFHRGCYTTHAEQKQSNRDCERLLYEVELWRSLAAISLQATRTADSELSNWLEQLQPELETHWKTVLLNQFHDILPGSSITEVFVDANHAWKTVELGCGDTRDQLFSHFARFIGAGEPPHPQAERRIVYNLLNWTRSSLVELEANPGQRLHVWNAAGASLPSDCSAGRWQFPAEDVPPIGYRVFWTWVEDGEVPATVPPENWTLENDHLRVTIDPQTGDIARLFDRVNQREVLSGAGNQLQAFEDKGQYWDAWNIDPNYTQHPLPPAKLESIQWQEWSHLRSRLRVTRRIGQSTFQQDYILEAHSPLLKIETVVEWQERHVLVKAAFPLTVEADFATYEIPCGAIERTTRPQTEQEKAQWEVPAIRWADLSDGSYGASLLNNCKHGYDAQPSQLRLTLLRGTEFPDPDADRGTHRFSYALYPHAGDWRSANTVQRGYELNSPLYCSQSDFEGVLPAPTLLPMQGSLLHLGAENLVLMALKQAEDSPDAWIVRCYECQGEAATLDLRRSLLPLQLVERVDLLERTIEKIEGQTVTVRPWEIASFKITVG